MGGVQFEWDKAKSWANLQKHGIGFEEAATVFDDAEALLIDDPDHSFEEARFIILGFSYQRRLLVVCHCYRQPDERIRLISARRATRREVRYYIDQYTRR